MTQISYIAGIKADERADRAANVPVQSYINYTALTDGELRLTLLADQVNMLAAYYPENRDLQKAKNMLVDALYKGVHRTPLPGGIHTGTLATVISEIRKAQNRTRPAAGKIFDRVNGIGQGISDPLIPYDDCQIWVENPNYGDQAYAGDPPGWWKTDEYCTKMNALKEILNKNLEKSSHHILYEFVANPNAQPQTVAYKALNHRAVNATLSNISKVSNDNMKMWVRNGIIRNNALKGAGAIQPEETIKIFKENAGIGIAPMVIAAIISAVASAIVATAQLVASCKKTDPQTAALWNQFQGIGTGVFGPEGEDWQTVGGQGPTGEETDYLPLLLLGGAAALLL